MSVRASSSAGFLTALLVAGPVMALVNQAATYSTAVWACGHHSPGAIHIVPALTLAVTLVASVLAFRGYLGIRKANTADTDDTDRPLSSSGVRAVTSVSSVFVVPTSGRSVHLLAVAATT